MRSPPYWSIQHLLRPSNLHKPNSSASSLSRQKAKKMDINPRVPKRPKVAASISSGVQLNHSGNFKKSSKIIPIEGRNHALHFWTVWTCFGSYYNRQWASKLPFLFLGQALKGRTTKIWTTQEANKMGFKHVKSLSGCQIQHTLERQTRALGESSLWHVASLAMAVTTEHSKRDWETAAPIKSSSFRLALPFMRLWKPGRNNISSIQFSTVKKEWFQRDKLDETRNLWNPTYRGLGLRHWKAAYQDADILLQRRLQFVLAVNFLFKGFMEIVMTKRRNYLEARFSYKSSSRVSNSSRAASL